MITHAWDVRFLQLAKQISTWSQDLHTQVGAVIVTPTSEVASTGYNGFPRGTRDEEQRYERPAKYLYTEHAERNAIYNAARNGVALNGCTIYVETSEPADMLGCPCIDCSRAIIQSGIVAVVHRPIGKLFRKEAERLGGWRATCFAALDLLQEAKVQQRWIVEEK